MVGYVEKPINLESNMTALAAKDATFTSAPHLQGPPLTPDNIVIQEFPKNPHPNNISQPNTNPSTSHSIAFRIANPMVAVGDVHHHHDIHQLVDLATLWEDIAQTFDTFHAFLKAFISSHVPINSVQPTTKTSASIVTGSSMDANDDHHDHQHTVTPPSPRCEICCTCTSPVDNIVHTPPLHASPQLTTMTTTTDMNNDDNHHDDCHGNHCQPNDNHWYLHNDHCTLGDLIALQWEIWQTMSSANEFFSSLLPILTNTACNNLINGQLTKTMNALMTMPHPNQEYLTLWDYLSSLHTAACFIPAQLLCWSTWISSSTLQLPTQQFMPMKTTPHMCLLGHKNTRMPTAQHQPLPVTPTPSMDVQWMPIARALPAQLDQPPDHHPTLCPTHKKPQFTLSTPCLTYNDTQLTKVWGYGLPTTHTNTFHRPWKYTMWKQHSLMPIQVLKCT